MVTKAKAAPVRQQIRASSEAKEILCKISNRMGWTIGQAAEASARLAEKASDNELLAALREPEAA